MPTPPSSLISRRYHPSDLVLALLYAIMAGLRRINKTDILQYNGTFLPLLGLCRFPDQSTLRRFLKVSVRCSHVPFVAVATAFFECLALTGSKGGKRWHGDGRKKSRRSFGNAAGVRRRLDEWFRPLRQRGGLCRASPGSMGFSPHGSGGG